MRLGTYFLELSEDIPICLLYCKYFCVEFLQILFCHFFGFYLTGWNYDNEGAYNCVRLSTCMWWKVRECSYGT